MTDYIYKLPVKLVSKMDANIAKRFLNRFVNN